MKVSLNWVKQFTEIDVSTEELVKKIGEQLGAVEEIIELSPIYKDVLVAEVKSCEKHPNADKLSVCLIDDGGAAENVERKDGLVELVCGAPNVKQGQKVAWLPPGSVVPSTYHTDPFVLEARELRGVVSNGMIASARELAIGDEHDGILEVDVEAAPGQKFADVYQLNDTIIDIENKMFTHRPDCFGQLGVAREIAGICHKQFSSPDWYKAPLAQENVKRKKENGELKLAVQNDILDLVPRFVCVPIADVKVGHSPVAIRTWLARVGIKPINNIVDITNYVMMLTGQPLHAYDYDKLLALQAGERSTEHGALSLEVRKSREGEKLRLLGDKEITFKDDSTMLITSNDVPVGVGGIMGGADTEVDESTKNIVLECANFDMYQIRRTAMSLGLFTDAVTRFNKGQSPLQNDTVLEEAVSMIQSITGGRVAGEVQDARGEVDPPNQVEITADFVAERLAEPINADDIVRLLGNVEFQTEAQDDTVRVTVPFWRTDIAIREDIVEEVGRLMGFHHLPINLPKRTTYPVEKNHLLEIKSKIRDALTAAGGNELLTYSFVHGDLLAAVGQDVEKAFKLSNALSPDLQYYRLSIVPSLLEKVYGNLRAGYDKFFLYEIGKTHIKDFNGDDGLPREEERTAGVVVSKGAQPAYFQAKHIVGPYVCF
ncbi:MAG: phenylalanine--tRNA ligase subunit beta [Candidatus Saccharibacteria bacterium]|nr:phenylalanine--tRNA ligase subunit beta [Candidatus Saccharibacteria bacterium]